jgi:hypothetical protein
MRMLIPGFGAGAVSGRVVLRVDHAIIAWPAPELSLSSENVRVTAP